MPPLPDVTGPLGLALVFTVAGVVLFKIYSSTKTAQPVQSPFPRGNVDELAETPSGEVTKVSNYPEGWWTSEELFQTEQRAIFAKTPIAVAHASMFEKPGSYHTIDHPSGYPLFLILGKDHVLRGFHNVCRHRAFPVISSKPSGCSLVLGCKYHGWSYDVQGNLVKAPKFDEIEEFDKKSNSLFEVNVQVDDSGVVFVDVDSIPSSEYTRVGVDRFGKGVIESWEIEGRFNWKVAESADAFYFPTLTGKNNGPPAFQGVVTILLFPQYLQHSKPTALSDIFVSSRHGACLMITIRPISAEKCHVKGSLYSDTSESSRSVMLQSLQNELSQCVARLEKIYAQAKTLGAITDTAHHRVILDRIRSHRQIEKTAGHKVWPTSYTKDESNSELEAAEVLAQELQAKATARRDVEGKNAVSALAW